MDVYSFTIKDTQVDMTYRGGFLVWTFEKNGETYGSKLKLPSRGIMDIVSVATLLTINVIESLERLNK